MHEITVSSYSREGLALRLRREFLEHLLHCFVDWLLNSLGVTDAIAAWTILQSMRRNATPNSVFGPGIGHVDHEGAFSHCPRLRTRRDASGDGVECRRPAWICRGEIALSRRERGERKIRIVLDFSQALRRHLLVDGCNDVLLDDGICQCSLVPGVGLVFGKIASRIGRDLHLLSVDGEGA